MENYGSVDVITRVEDDCVVGRTNLRFSIMPVALHCISSQLRGESEQPRTSRIAPGDAKAASLMNTRRRAEGGLQEGRRVVGGGARFR